MNEISKSFSLESWKKTILFLSMAGMFAGLLVSRWTLSFALIVFVVVSIVHKDILVQLRTFFASPVLWSMSILFALPFISGLWSTDVSHWLQILRIKLPLLLLPVSFAGIKDFNFKDWEKIAFSFLAVMWLGIAASFWNYLQHAGAIHAGYLEAHTMETPLNNDHVRFSLLVTIAVVTATFLLIQKNNGYKASVRFFLWVTLAVFILYLHVLAVRTGLICFYVGLLIYFISLFAGRENKISRLMLLLFIVAMPVLSYFIFPTFKNRIAYLKYDFSLVRQNVLRAGSNDGDRIFSIEAGWYLMEQHPITGVGFGDLQNEMAKFYEINYPTAAQSDRILPSSEWMIHGASTGWPGLIIFSLALFVPFAIKRPRENILWILLNIFMACSYLFDIGLEVQYGVWMHAFVLLWWYKWLDRS